MSAPVSAPASTRQRILAAAERRLRRSGYHAVSFRDLAQDVGIKSASVHHHFPTKAALVATLVEDYAARFLDGIADAPAGPDRLARTRQGFRAALTDTGGMCLCGLLAAESGGLPEAVRAATAGFFDRLADALTDGSAPDVSVRRQAAIAALAQLEGALLLARARNDPTLFDTATASMV